MGFGGIGPGSIILILLIVILLFGTKKLRNIGSDLGGAIKSFKKSMKDGEGEDASASLENLKDDLGDSKFGDSKFDGEKTVGAADKTERKG